jgi:hypothetical protein
MSINNYLLSLLSESKISDLLVPYGPDEHPGWTLLPDGSYDVDVDVNLSSQHLKKLPYKFHNVTGNFYCHSNQLTSLEGAPKSVGGDFSCSSNQLTSLEGAPKSVGGNFSCRSNKKKFTEDDVRKVCKVKGEISV